jgi:hypothetical protein
MNPSLKSALLLALVAAAASGCATLSPNLDAAFGSSVDEATARQTLDPKACLDTDPVAGLDGAAAVSAVRHYKASFNAPAAPANVFAIGVGSAAAMGPSPASSSIP